MTAARLRRLARASLLPALMLWHGSAAAADIGIGLRASTLGAGAELSVALFDQITLRVPFHSLSFSTDREENELAYDARVKLRSIGLIGDYHPFGGGWRLSAGVLSNGNAVSVRASEATGNTEFAIGGRRYRSDPDDPLQVLGDIDFGSVAPYVGMGWGNAARGERRVYVGLEIGAMFQGSAAVDLQGQGTAEDIDSGERFDVQGNSMEAQIFRAELAAEQRELRDDLSDFKIFPVIAITVGWRF